MVLSPKAQVRDDRNAKPLELSEVKRQPNGPKLELFDRLFEVGKRRRGLYRGLDRRDKPLLDV